jgi:proteasome beta subunit
VRLAVRALVAAADEDTATGGPDARRGIYPNVAVVTAEGYRPVADEEVAAEVAAIGAEERSRP